MNTPLPPATPSDMDQFEADVAASPIMTYWARHIGQMRRSSTTLRYINPEVDLIWIGYKIAKGLT